MLFLWSRHDEDTKKENVHKDHMARKKNGIANAARRRSKPAPKLVAMGDWDDVSTCAFVFNSTADQLYADTAMA